MISKLNYFIILFCFIFFTQAYAQEWNPKNLLIYPIEKPTRKDQRIFLDKPLPSNLTVGNLVVIRAAKGEFEPASFALVSTERIDNLRVSVSDLTGPGGVSIPKEAVDLKIVKNWYQSYNTVDPLSVNSDHPNAVKTLLPELLLNDDSLVKVDLGTQKNYLRVRVDGIDKYIDVSSPDSIFPANAQVFDAATLQPFNMSPNNPKQIWITVKVPEEISAGDYTGIITIQSGAVSKTLELRVSVLPFSLAPSLLEYSIYYRSTLSSTDASTVGSERKSKAQLSAEFANMRNHGVLNPTIYQGGYKMLGEYLDVRNSVPGLSRAPFYYLGYLPKKASTPQELAIVQQTIIELGNTIENKGYSDLHVYGIDEARGDELLAQRPAWQAVHEAGAKVFVAGYVGTFDRVGDLLDVLVVAGGHRQTEVDKFHSVGHRIYRYGWPQAGIENPEIYRRNYGIPLMIQGYDGVMNYAYQHGFGNSIWNDFDASRYKDNNFTYPTSDGVIDTIQWEGFREGVDDVRYLSTLIALDKYNSKESILQWVEGELQKDRDLDTIREKIVSKILSMTKPMTAIPNPTKLLIVQ